MIVGHRLGVLSSVVAVELLTGGGKAGACGCGSDAAVCIAGVCDISESPLAAVIVTDQQPGSKAD
jgi:hypothetical protein